MNDVCESRSEPRRRAWRWIAVVAAVALTLAAGCSSADDGEAADGSAGGPTPSDGAEVDTMAGVVRTPPLSVGDQSLPEVDAAGVESPFSFVAPTDGLLLMYFGYTSCPDVCPTTLADIRIALRDLVDPAIAERVEVAMATVDPERDTPEVLAGYLGFFTEEAGIVDHPLRTEDLAELETVEDAFLTESALVPLDDGTYDVEHVGTVFVIDDSGHVVVEWPFGLSPDAMASDLELLLDETR